MHPGPWLFQQTLDISAIKMSMHPGYFSNKNNMAEAVHKVSHAVDIS
jgi:hypothetical protein